MRMGPFARHTQSCRTVRVRYTALDFDCADVGTYPPHVASNSEMSLSTARSRSSVSLRRTLKQQAPDFRFHNSNGRTARGTGKSTGRFRMHEDSMLCVAELLCPCGLG